MENRNTFTKSLAIIGTILAWLPLAAPFFFGFVSLSMDGIYRFDYLMPAEFAFLAFAGGIMLLWAAIRTRKRLGIIAWGLGIAITAMVVLMLVGDVVPGTLEYWLAMGMLLVNALAVLMMGIGGILLWRDLFRKVSSTL
jgi:lipid-A-disaccharide synthase-like uncharacterized protein